nr:MAG TPA: Neck appendage protein [Caudoviricetes sp.]
MIYLFDKDEKLIKIVKKEAIKTALQKFALTTEKYVSDRLTVEMKELSKKEFDAVEYMAIQSIEDAHTFHYFYIAQKFSENLTTLIGVQSGIEELRKSVVLDKRPHNTFARPIIDELLAGTNWQARFVSETSQRSTNFYYISTFEALKKVCQVWNLEMQFFVEVNGNKIGARYIDFKEKIGEATGKRVVYGHNALQILQEVERTNLFTALIGRGKGEELSAPNEENSHGTYGRRITFEDVVWETKKGNPVDKPKGQKYVELPEMTKRYGIKNADGTMRAKVGFAVFEDEEDKNVLIKRTYDELVRASRPQLTLKTSTVYLKGVKIGDTIRVVRHDKKLDYDTRIFEITFNRLNNESSDIKLGDRISESNEAKIQNIASQKVDELVSSGFNNIVSKLPEFLPSPEGFNNNWYGKDDPTKKYVGKVLVNDIWFKPNPEHEGQTIMLRWTGEVWQEIIRSNSDQEIIDEISKRFENLNLSGVDEAKAKAEEALKKARAGVELADEAKDIAEKNQITFASMANRVNKQEDEITNFKNEYGSKMLEVTQTTDGIKTKIGEITSFIDKDGQRQEELKRYAKEETAKQTNTIRETLSQDFVAKSTYLENVEGTKQRFEALTRENETKLAEYKQGIDGRITDIASQVAGKVNEVDFQRVRETAQLYERILGTDDSNVSTNIARMALTSELFNVEVGKRFSNLTNLFYAPTKIPKYISSVATDNHLERVSFGDHDGIRINYTDSMSGWLGVRFPLTKKFVKQGESLGYRIEISVDKVPKDGKVLIQLLDNTPSLGMYYNSQIELTKTGNQVFTGYLDIPYTGELNEYSIRFTLTTPGNIIIHKPMIIDRRLIPEQFVDSTDYNNEYTRTTMSILKDSFAFKTLNNNGDVLSALNLATGGASLEVGKNKLVVTPETTYIADGTIKKAMIGNAQIGTAHIGEIDASKANIINISAKNVVMDSAMARLFVSSDIFTDSLAAKTAFINKLRSSVVTANLLEGFKGRIGGFQIGTHDKDPSVYWLTGQNQFDVGMSNGSSAWGQTALWVNWGNNWDKPGEYAWYIRRTGEMFCRNSAGFFKTVDFADKGTVNFYGRNNFYSNLYMGKNEIYGNGWSPRQGNNAVVWWNQVGDGTVKYWSDKASDRRLKENIAPTTINALDIINKLDMVEFDFIKDKKHEEIGLIAQEVEKIIPQAISRNPENEDDFLHIDYTIFVPYLIKAIQELNQKLEEVNERRN